MKEGYCDIVAVEFNKNLSLANEEYGGGTWIRRCDTDKEREHVVSQMKSRKVGVRRMAIMSHHKSVIEGLTSQQLHVLGVTMIEYEMVK